MNLALFDVDGTLSLPRKVYAPLCTQHTMHTPGIIEHSVQTWTLLPECASMSQERALNHAIARWHTHVSALTQKQTHLLALSKSAHKGGHHV